VATAYEELLGQLRKLPGLGTRSAERICIHLLAEKPAKIPALIHALQQAREKIRRCQICGNLSEDEHCSICTNPNRDRERLCIVESIPDLVAFEKAGAWSGVYHVLHGKLSPIKGIGPEHLNMASLAERLVVTPFREVLLALPNDIEGEATCHYLQEQVLSNHSLHLSRIGFGLPSGGDIPYADATTLRNALESRRGFMP
jgi:recombination protein RecR